MAKPVAASRPAEQPAASTDQAMVDQDEEEVVVDEGVDDEDELAIIEASNRALQEEDQAMDEEAKVEERH